MPATFYSGPTWEQSSGPIVSRKVHMDDGADSPTALVWPEGGSWATLTAGEHPILAIGRKANRPYNITGVVMTFDSKTDTAQFNVADKVISRQYVINVTRYDAQNDADTWQNTVYPMDPVFVDDSAAVAAAGAGVTLSFSPLNDAEEANPLAGYVFWCQDEYADSGVGGPNASQDIPQPAAEDTTEVLTLCVMQVNDLGIGNLYSLVTPR